LKPDTLETETPTIKIAPITGARIETVSMSSTSWIVSDRPHHGGAD